ncbi:hypothetical protein RB213_007880 [Colletotrichum asianum]
MPKDQVRLFTANAFFLQTHMCRGTRPTTTANESDDAEHTKGGGLFDSTKECLESATKEPVHSSVGQSSTRKRLSLSCAS